MNNLILYTNRSGSTVLQDIISYAEGCVNLGEGLHSLARSYNYNSETNKQTKLYTEFFKENISAKHYNVKTKGADYIDFFQSKKQRINLLKSTTDSWVVKDNLEKKSLDVSFIDYCYDSGVNVYITHRRDVVSQFISKINARYRSEIANNGDFIFTNNTPVAHYDTIDVSFVWLNMYTNVFLEQLMMWRIMYERYKSKIKLVSYEDCIAPMNFTSIGISNDTVVSYLKESQHLVPTPNNITNVKVQNDHPSPIASAWDQSLYLIEKHKYLVEV